MRLLKVQLQKLGPNLKKKVLNPSYFEHNLKFQDMVYFR